MSIFNEVGLFIQDKIRVELYVITTCDIHFIPTTQADGRDLSKARNMVTRCMTGGVSFIFHDMIQIERGCV